MKLLQFMVLTLYRWYDKGSSKKIAYESAIMCIGLFIWVNLYTILIFLKVDYFITSSLDNLNKIESLIKILFFYSIGYLLIIIFIPKKKILALNNEKSDNGADYFYLLAYCIVSIILFLIEI